MPHDKKGRLIEIGDHVKFKTWAEGAERLRVGRVFSVSPGSETCNASVVHLQPGYWPIAQACVTAKDCELVLKADGSEPADAITPAGVGGFGRLGAIVAMLLLSLAAIVGAAFAADPPPPSAVQKANAEGFAVNTQMGAMVVTTSESGTGLTPTIWADAEGPLAYGDGNSIGRIGARIGLTGTQGKALDGTSLNYKGVEVDLRAGRVIGLLGDVRTVLLAEYGFTTLIKGATQARPVQGLAHSFGAGLSFESKDGTAQLAILPGFDEATTSCVLPIVCTGMHSGFAILIYGHVPILDGRVLFGGDVSIAAAPSGAGVTRTSVERVFTVVDPVRVFEKAKPKPAPDVALSRRRPVRTAGLIGPIK